MYARQSEERTLTFRVSGRLWNDSLVMIDDQTGSFWSHLLGEAMQGPLVGTRLETLPSVITSWGAWYSSHPQTTLCFMPRSAGSYEVDQEGRWARDLVIGLVLDGRSRAWPLRNLKRQPLVNEEFAGTELLVVYRLSSGAAAIYDRRLDDRLLHFEWRDEKLLDAETSSEWDLLAGKAVAGPLDGSTLKPLPGIISYDKAWTVFHPKTSRWTPAADKPSQ